MFYGKGAMYYNLQSSVKTGMESGLSVSVNQIRSN